MIANRSMPDASIVPVLAYPDVNEAAGWLCAAFGFERRLLIGDHRVQLTLGDGAVVAAAGGSRSQSIADVDPAEWGGVLVGDG